MVKFSSPRNRFLLSVLCVALAGCGKTDTASVAPQNAAPSSAASASTAPKSVTPNSFDETTAQLDPGGDLYGYLNTAQWLSHLSTTVDTFHDLILSGSTGMQIPAENKAQAEKVFSILKDAIDKSGVEDISGVGASSLAIAPGLFRNKMFAHHYPDKSSGLIWSLYGGDPHPLTGLDFMPADAALGGVGDFDLAKLINFLRDEGSQFPEAKPVIAQWQTQFAATGLQLDDVLNSLSGSMGMVITLDATGTITVPISGQPQTIATPRIALLIGVKNDLIFKRVDQMATGNPMVVKVDEPGLAMRTMSIPAVPGLNLRPTVAQWNGYLVIATDDKLVRDMIAVQKGAPGYKSTEEYKTLSAGLPEQGNRFVFVTQRFTETLAKFQSQIMASQPGANPAQTAMMQRFFSTYQQNGRAYAVGVHLPNGMLTVSQGSQGSSQILAPLLIIPVAAVASMSVPAFAGVNNTAKETASIAKGKQIFLACQMYANDHAGAFPTTLDALFPTYLTDRSVLVSPLMTTEPVGYDYSPPAGAAAVRPGNPSETIVLEDKFGALLHVRILVFADGSARVAKPD